MESKLNAILELTREPHATDDVFVGRVMARVRAHTERRSWRRGLFTRPALLGVAAVMVTGGAVAAVVRSADPDPTPEVTVQTTGDAGPRAQPSPRQAGSRAAPQPSDERTAEDSDRLRTFRHDDLEWGYTSPHTAYVLDHASGLRLETETYENEFPVAKPRVVTLTLANTGERPIAISAPKGCALSVAAYRAQGDESGDPSSFKDPTTASDPERARSWKCAGSAEDPSDQREDETFVLEPGARRVADAKVVLDAEGDWSVLGMCRCSYAQADEPPPAADDNPLDDLGKIGVDLPTFPAPPLDTDEQSKGLFTPPIRVEAS